MTAQTKTKTKTKTKTTRKKKTAIRPKASSLEPAMDPAFARVNSPDALTRVADAFAGDRRVSYGKMFASMGLKVNGKIFAMHVKGRFVTKLPKDRVNELVRQGKGDYFDPGHGRLMKEWIALRGSTPPWIDLAREACQFVGGPS